MRALGDYRCARGPGAAGQAAADARSGPLIARRDAGRGVDSGRLPQPRRLGKWEIAMIFTARKKKLCIVFLVLAGLVSIGIGMTRYYLPHRVIPTVLGGALIAVAVHVVTIEPG